MSNEEQKPVPNDEELETIAESVPAPDEYPAGQAEVMVEHLPDDANAVEEAVVEAVAVTEAAQETAPVQAFDKVVSSVQAAIERVGDSHTGAAHPSGDTTVFMGREYPFPVYTFVFMILGVLTLIEVLIAEIISNDITIPILLGIAIVKAGLVVWFYMHLNHDSRIFALVLAVPVGLAIISTLFLIGIPTGGY